MCVSPRVCSVGVYSEPQGNASKSKSRVQIFMHRGRGVLISISLPYYNGSALTVFFYKSPPNSIYTRAGEA